MSEKKYPLILKAMSETPWAVTLDMWVQIREIIDFRSKGGKLTHEEIRERIGVRKPAAPQFFEIENGERFEAYVYSEMPEGMSLPPPHLASLEPRAARRPAKATSGTVAVLPMFGVISPRLSAMEEGSGGLSLERFSKVFREQVNDPVVKAIVLNIDSPGGSAAGVAEFAEEVFAARKEKHIVAIANHMAASAAFWIASAADELVVSTSGAVGSVGVFMAHIDISELEKMLGVKTTLISSGKFKTEGNPFEPLTEAALEHFQDISDDIFEMFVNGLARGRGVSAAKVRRDFGEGRMALAEDAVSRGMADRVATLDKVLFDLGAKGARKGMRAEGDTPAFSQEELEFIAHRDLPGKSELFGLDETKKPARVEEDQNDDELKTQLEQRSRRLSLMRMS